ncbi:hypothetical protein [Tepidibacter hydrothermalis]|uniref:Uncharacterized protein n=1 Tax=Tepidibacter hydrothermalis TaxID=3036126 RepID=A0ABY8EF39_9FIRM|nr:hypothetical protein [Tepidibacter hydrothermalis]WFD11570.1 hypothetical protein P4S50_05705 [Tepidibacter hydrothermalis]
MGRLERTIENKKNKKNKRTRRIFTWVTFIIFLYCINIVDYRTRTFMGIYDEPIYMKVYTFVEGLSYKIR